RSVAAGQAHDAEGREAADHDVPRPRRGGGDRARLVVAELVRTAGVVGGGRLRAVAHVQVRITGAARHLHVQRRGARRDVDGPELFALGISGNPGDRHPVFQLVATGATAVLGLFKSFLQ